MHGCTRKSKPKTTSLATSACREDGIREKDGDEADALIAKYASVFEPIIEKSASRDRAVAIAQPQLSSVKAECICTYKLPSWSLGEWRLFVVTKTEKKRTPRTKPLDLTPKNERRKFEENEQGKFEEIRFCAMHCLFFCIFLKRTTKGKFESRFGFSVDT